MKTMKRAFFITIAIIGLSAFSANAQSKVTPTLAKGTPSARQNQPVTGAHKPEMAAYGKTPGAQYRQAANKPTPVLAPSAARSSGTEPKK
jgi:hypothetical protein